MTAPIQPITTHYASSSVSNSPSSSSPLRAINVIVQASIGPTERILTRRNSSAMVIDSEHNAEVERTDIVAARVLVSSTGHLIPENIALSIEGLNRTLALNNNDAVALTSRGRLHYLIGNVDFALTNLNVALLLDENNPLALHFRSEIHVKKGDLDLAIADLDKSLALDDNNALALASRGDIHKRKGNFDLALADLDKSLALNGNNSTALRIRSEIHISNEKLDLALVDLDKSLALDNKTAGAFTLRGSLHSRLTNWDLAIADLDKALELDNKDALAFASRGEIHGIKGNPDLAIADLDRSIELNKNNAIFFQIRGNNHLSKGNLDLSLNDLNRSIALNGTSPKALSTRGTIHRKKGNLELSLLDFVNCMKINPKYTFSIQETLSAIYHRGKFFLTREKYGDALVDFVTHRSVQTSQTLPIGDILNRVSEKTSYSKENNRIAPLFTDLLNLHDQLAEAATPRYFSLDPMSKGTFVDMEHHATPPKTQYEHVFKLLIALQELDENKASILRIDNKREYQFNVGEQYAFALSGILMHSEVNKNVVDPIGQYIDTVIETYANAKTNGRLCEFFEKAFNPKKICLGGKSETLTEYAANLTMDLEEVPDIGNFTPQANVGEFFRAFRAKQTSKMAIEKTLNRAELKSSLSAEMSPHHASFYAEYCTVEKFTEYLNGYPASQAVKDCIPFLISLESFQA